MAHLSDEERAFLNASLPLLRSNLDSGGATIFYREAGPMDGEVVILLHGLGASSIGWRAVIAGLPRDVRIIAWDAPGYGGSAPLPSGHSDEFGHADALKAFCDGLGIDRAHIVGSSWGGALAVSFAKRHPDYVRSLTLLAPNRCFAWLPDAEREALRARLLDPNFLFNAPKGDFLGMLIAPESDALVAERAFVLTDQLTEMGYQHAVDMMLQTDTLATADGVMVPTIVLAGDQDVLAPMGDHARPIAEAIKGSVFWPVSACGHLIELECPQIVISAVSEQLSASQVK